MELLGTYRELKLLIESKFPSQFNRSLEMHTLAGWLRNDYLCNTMHDVIDMIDWENGRIWIWITVR
jgi:hypothetical protein